MRLTKFFFVISAVLFLSSCAQKVYFFEAQKLKTSDAELLDQKQIYVNSFFAGDALDYVIFELDVDNQSPDSIQVSYRNVYLEVYNGNNTTPIILDALHKEDVLSQIRNTQDELAREKRARDIGNAVDIGFNLLFIGTTGGFNSLNALLYSTDVASYMLEDARSHKLMVGSLEEQMAYVDEWVLYKKTLLPQQSDSWDILFPRSLFDAHAKFVLKIDGLRYTQDFDLDIIEEKVKR